MGLEVKRDLSATSAAGVFVVVLLTIGCAAALFIPARDVAAGLFLATAGAVISSTLVWYLVARTTRAPGDNVRALLFSYGKAARQVGNPGGSLSSINLAAIGEHLHELPDIVVNADRSDVRSALNDYVAALEAFCSDVRTIRAQGGKRKAAVPEGWSRAKGRFLTLCLTQADIVVPIGIPDELAHYKTSSLQTLRRLW